MTVLDFQQKLQNVLPALWHINDISDEPFDEEYIPSGSLVNFIDDNTGDDCVGKYISLWGHSHDDSSPYADGRTMAYIIAVNDDGTLRGTYADTLYISLYDDSDIDWLRYEMELD